MTPVPIGTINWIITDPRSSYVYALDSNGRVWFSTSTRLYLLLNSAIDTGTGTVTNASGNGLVSFATSDASATYLFVFRNGVIDVINIYGDTAIEALAWSNSWQSMNTPIGTGNSHHAIVGQDNIIYFCDGRFVGSILEKAGSVFDPASGATYGYTNQALDLPQNDTAQCLEELGTNLLIGGNISNVIYPWNRIADSFSLVITVPEYSIKRMKNIGGRVYILPGFLGNIYSTQGSYVTFVKKIPTYLVNSASSIQANEVTWGGIGAVNGALIFGVGGLTSGSSGIYRLYEDGRLIHDNTPSIGSTNVIGLYAHDNFYLMGYAGGADNFSNLTLYANYNTVIQSALYRLGNKTQKASYTELEVQVARPATTGHIRIKYRSNESSSFADFPSGAVSITANSVDTSFNFDIGLIDIENLQIQIEMDGQFELMEVRLIP